MRACIYAYKFAICVYIRCMDVQRMFNDSLHHPTEKSLAHFSGSLGFDVSSMISEPKSTWPCRNVNANDFFFFFQTKGLDGLECGWVVMGCFAILHHDILMGFFVATGGFEQGGNSIYIHVYLCTRVSSASLAAKLNGSTAKTHPNWGL